MQSHACRVRQAIIGTACVQSPDRDTAGADRRRERRVVRRSSRLAEAIAATVRDGDSVALEGFTHLIPFAAGHEIIRQGRRDLTLIRMTPGPDLRPDDRHGLRPPARLLVGRQPGRRQPAPLPRRRRARLAGAARARGAQPRGDGEPLRRRRRRACRSPSSAATRAATSPRHTDTISRSTCPFTGERLDGGQRAQPGRHGDPRPAVPTARATSSCGASPASRRRPCSRARARWSRSRSSSTCSSRAPAQSCCRPGRSTTSRTFRAARTRPTRTATRARQRLLRRLGRDQPRPRHLPRVDGGACPRRLSSAPTRRAAERGRRPR